MAFKINGILVSGLGTNGAGVPTGGTSTQILQKNSNVDFDTSWVDAPIIPTKTSEIENNSDFATNASVDEKLQSHRNNTEVHITAEERELWNGANTYTDTAIANLVGSAPDTLNTLEEISKALNEDAEYVINLASKIDTKQDTLTGELNQVVSFDADGKVISKTLIASDVGAVDADYVTGEISAVQVEIDELLETKANAESPVLSGSLGLNHTGELGFSSASLGFANEASGMYCFSEGMGNKSTGDASHTEGTGNTASADAAHAEGYGTLASGVGSHAEGANTKATGYGSHAEGSNTIASIEGQHVEGKYNIDDTTAIHIVGNGTSNTKRSNAHTLNLNGEAWFAGDVYVGSTSGTHKDEGSKKLASEDYVKGLVKSLNSNLALSFYCVEDVTIITNGVSVTYPANSNVEVKFLDTDIFEIVPTSNYSIMALNAFPGALGTYYPWLEGVKQFSNILFDMNNEDFYSKWSQGNQGAYQVQFAQYVNCIFWSDNPYISDVSKRTNYTLYYTSQLPLCYSSIPDNTFKAFFLAFNVNNDPNWGNKAYRDSFAKATWATQAFSYYGARTIGIFGHDDPDFNITLPADCRGLMYASTAIENAGTFDAINVTNFGAKSGSWRDAFGQCTSLRNLYIKNLKVNLNVSWSPLNYDSIYFIISKAANTDPITISVSPYTYNLLNPSDFELAASKNITIALLTANYIEDKRMGEIANKADKDEIVQSDWNQNDESATDYVKNRTHWVDYAETILDSEVFECTTLASDSTSYYCAKTGNIGLVSGKKYNVIVNGTKYTVSALSTFETNDISLIAEVDECRIYDRENGIVEVFTDNSATLTITIEEAEDIYVPLDEKFIPDTFARLTDINAKMNAENPNGTGSLSLNRASGSEIGENSITLGTDNIASGASSVAIGLGTSATGLGSYAEGSGSIASGDMSHASGQDSTAAGFASYAEGSSEANGDYSHAAGYSIADGDYSYASGNGTWAVGRSQTVIGEANIEDEAPDAATRGTYAFIVGNGDMDAGEFSNAHTLDWNGNGWFAGNLYVGGTSQEDGSKIATETFVSNSLSSIQSQIDTINASLAAAVEELSKI